MNLTHYHSPELNMLIFLALSILPSIAGTGEGTPLVGRFRGKYLDI